MLQTLTNDFVVGTVIGLVISFIGSTVQAYLVDRFAQRSMLATIRDFAADVVGNLISIIIEMDNARDRSRAIHDEYIGMINDQINVFFRNYEQLVRLPSSIRGEVRQFVNKVGFYRTLITSNLENFYRYDREATRAKEADNEVSARDYEVRASLALKEAQIAADKLTTLARTADKVEKLLSIKV